ncbi:MAG: LLM class flavin-dependent oxidoreductase [Candidatus Binataceae bacterium]
MPVTKYPLGLHMTLAAGMPGRYPEFARRAEELGYGSLWMAEAGGADALVNLGSFAAMTSRLELATGVLPIQIRTPAAMAAAFLTLNDISNGRAIAGLGVSSPIIVERWHGASYRKPLTAMRECVAIMRQLFTDGRAKFSGEIYKSDFRLGFRPAATPAPRIYLAALNAPMLRLAGEIADGVLLNYSPPDAVAAMAAEVRAGAETIGRNPDDVDIAIYIRMCITPDERNAMDAFKRELAGYSFVESYGKMFARYGLSGEFAEVRRLWQAGKRDEAPSAISDASVLRLAAFNTGDGRGMVARFRAAGITRPVIFPVGPRETAEKSFAETITAMAGT